MANTTVWTYKTLFDRMIHAFGRMPIEEARLMEKRWLKWTIKMTFGPRDEESDRIEALRELDPDRPVCYECYKPCRVRMIDIGIGSYEYCGAPGVDSRMVEASDCCEASIVSAGKMVDLLD